MIRISHYPTMSGDVEFITSEFDIFAQKPVQTAILETNVVHYKPIATVDQTDLEFSIPADNETYIDLDIKLYVKGKIINSDGKDLDNTDFTAGTNNFLHSLFRQCSITLNGVNITPSSDLYNYRAYLETLLTYGTDAANTHLTTAYWYLDTGDVIAANDPNAADAKNKGFVERWNRQKQSKVTELYGRLHSDLCNVPQFLLPGVRLHVKLTKAKDDFFLMNANADSKTVFKFLDAELVVRRIRPSPKIALAHYEVLSKGFFARYNVTRVELKTFTLSSGPRAVSINNAVLGVLPKRLLFTMVKNTDFLGSRNTNPYNFRHYDLTNFALYVNGRQIPSEGLTLNMGHEKTSVCGYATLFEGSGIHHSNSGLQITHDMYINGFFMLLYDLTPDMAASEGHTSSPASGDIRIDLKFGTALPEAITCLLYLEYDNSVRIDLARNVSTDFA